MKILVTGAAGFIGFHVVRRLLNAGHHVTGVDNINSYYIVNLKKARLHELGIDILKTDYGRMLQSSENQHFQFVKLDIEDRDTMPQVFKNEKFDLVINLAAQAGMRHSVEAPFSYIDSNIIGFTNILECCRSYNVGHLVYASSSSVYGSNTKTPFSEIDRTDNPTSLYAATKRANELMASCYSHLYGLPATGLRFFSVYGPWGRADMAPMLFAQAILNNQPIKVFNNGDMLRDFTYISDIVDGIMLVVGRKPDVQPDGRRHAVYNIGGSAPVTLTDFVSELEKALGRAAQKEFMPMQLGDVYQTYSDTTAFERDFGYRPKTPLKVGLKKFAEWFEAEGYKLIENQK